MNQFKERVRELISQGYHVEVVNPDGVTFDQIYRVWQNDGWHRLKVAVVNSSGNVSGLQG